MIKSTLSACLSVGPSGTKCYQSSSLSQIFLRYFSGLSKASLRSGSCLSQVSFSSVSGLFRLSPSILSLLVGETEPKILRNSNFFQFYTMGWYLIYIYNIYIYTFFCFDTDFFFVFQEADSRPSTSETAREEPHLPWKQGGRGGHHGCDRQTQEITF